MKKGQAILKENILNKIQEMEGKNPEAFWKLVNNLKGSRESDGNIEPDVLYEYFKTLHKGINNTHLDLDYNAKIKNRLLNLKKTRMG